MGQIVKRKKKGRPPKSDLAKRSPKPPAPAPAPELDLRRSLRRRSVRYNFIDYDDYVDEEYELDEEEEEDEGDERRRAKKLKLVVKLDQGARGEHAQDSGASSSDEGEHGERKPALRGGGGGGGEDAEEEIGGDDDDEEVLKSERGRGDCAAIGFKPRRCAKLEMETALRLRSCPAQTRTLERFF